MYSDCQSILQSENGRSILQSEDDRSILTAKEKIGVEYPNLKPLNAWVCYYGSLQYICITAKSNEGPYPRDVIKILDGESGDFIDKDNHKVGDTVIWPWLSKASKWCVTEFN
jgi:hypothetical protein